MGSGNALKKFSPVRFDAQHRESVLRDGWDVVLSYADEGAGPFLVDLSHRPKWDVQHVNLSTVRPWDILFPETPGQCRLQEGRLVTRMNYTQAAVWSLTNDEADPEPEPFFTDMTNGLCILALVGEEVHEIMERITPLDLTSPDSIPPFLVQGPVLHVPSQVVVLANSQDAKTVLVAFSRGYGQAVAEAVLEAGRTAGLRPGGESVFMRAMDLHCQY